MGTRSCDHKVRHASINSAQKHADGVMGRLAMAMSPVVPFYCERHLCYHVGHNSRLTNEVAHTVAAAAWVRADLTRKITDLEEHCRLFDMLSKMLGRG